MGSRVISCLQTTSGLQLARQVGLCLAPGPSSLAVFNRDFGLGLRHSSPSFLPRLVTFRPLGLRCLPFAIVPDKGQSLCHRSGAFVEVTSLQCLCRAERARPSRPPSSCPSAFAPLPKVAPLTVAPRGFWCSLGHSKARHPGA